MTQKNRMSADEERATIIRAQAGDIDARNTLIECWMDFVYTVARKRSFSGMEVDDLAQEGVLGLIRAIKKFDTGKELRFSTYAEYWVISFMFRSKIDRYTLVRKPLYHYSKHKGKPGIELESPASLDNPLSQGGFGFLLGISDYRQFVKEVDDREELELQRENLAGAVAMLSDSEAAVIRTRYGLTGDAPKSVRATAKAVGARRETVNSLELRAMRELRKALRA